MGLRMATGGEGPAPTVAIAVPGHTLGHLAYHFPEAGAVFTADSLMALGCGRVFEGTAPHDVGEPVETRRPSARDAGLLRP
jgi:glyoxylase-like metal-dependent hydrolase (beta-lactamase superfamily II)